MSAHDLAGIAIVGLAGRFPGARGPHEFWRLLAEGQEGLTRLSEDDLRAAGYAPERLLERPNYVPVRGLLEQPEWFDRHFFGLPPKEAEAMDPQHRVFLETAWEALEDAGCDPTQYPGLIGVFAGMSNNTYFTNFVRPRKDLVEAVGVVNAVLSNEKDFLATRLAYKLNLRGPALNIQTACSSSLVAVSVACQQLEDLQCDAALAGGVSITFPHARGYFFEEGGMTSPDGVCRPFDRRANGTVFANGAGVVVLKRLEDAVADGDQIYAVIRGHATNNDGAKKVSFAAPSIDGQAEVIALAQAVAGVSPESISYIEAHGTGTALGDPIEVAALAQVFGAATERRGFCALGSLKGNVGHLDAASGIAGLIKTALAFREEAIPPNLHSEEPNPALNLEETAFVVPQALQAWPRVAGTPRRAGVSSLGVGGTNVHVVLEEAPAAEATPASLRAALPLVLSAKSAAALGQRAAELAAHLEAHPEITLPEIAWTLGHGRQRFTHRRVITARDAASAVAALREAGAAVERVDERATAPVAFLFPGQGSQYAGMGRRLYETEAAFRVAFDECAQIFSPLLGVDFREMVHRVDVTDLGAARFSQPALFALNYATARLWESLGVEPAVLVGHSVGEFVAAVLAGVFSLEDGARLVARRAELVAGLPSGGMLAVRLGEAEATALLGSELSLAAVNSPRLCVLSGPVAAIEAAEAACREKNIAAKRLASAQAFHSAMVEPIVEPFLEAVRGISLQAPSRRLVSSVTGQVLTAEQATDPLYWARHLRQTVRFAEALGTLLAEHTGPLLECGPGSALTQLGRQHPGKRAEHDFATSLEAEGDEAVAIARALGRLWLSGVPLDWSRLTGGAARNVSLPTYPFERQRYFADLPAGLPMPLATAVTDGEAPPDALAPVLAFVPLEIAPLPEVPVAARAVEAPPSVEVRLRTLLSDLAGHDFSSVPLATSLLELGFDSLFLSQAAISITRGFGVKVAFRQLLRELGTLEALAQYLEAAGPVAPPASAAKSAPAAAPGVAAPAPGGVHGPFRPMKRETDSEMNASQRAWLREFIERYTARTAVSKQKTQEYRQYLSDPRAVSGFKQLWKELIYPIVAGRSEGPQLWDEDGNRWVDVTLSFGAALFGHGPEFVKDAVHEQLRRGIEIGPTSPMAGEVAKQLCEFVGHERVTFCNTGSEAVSGAVRVARTVTGRPRVVYFAGAYHGITDEMLGRPGGQGALPIAPGIPPEALAQALILEYGAPETLAHIEANAGDIAAVLVEAVQSRRPDFQPAEFLRDLRALTERHGIALIFDEIVTGFRCHPQGAQGYFGIRADIACYGKILGGGIPIGAIAGRAEYLDAFDGGAWQFGDDSFPEAAMTFFAGTFVRHPLALAAARSVLNHLTEAGPGLQRDLAARTERVVGEINAILAETPFFAPRFGSNWYLRLKSDFAFPGLLYALLRHRGVHIWEARPCFLCTTHTEADLEFIIEAFRGSVAELREQGFFSAAASSSAEEGPAPAPAAAERPAVPLLLPTSEGQQEVWCLCQKSATATAACNESWLLHLPGPLEVSALAGACQAVMDRHESLRSHFDRSGERLTVLPEVTLEMPLVDLSALSAEEQETETRRLRRVESSRVFVLEKPPLMTLQLLRFAPERHALLFNAHHLVCDGWSCDVFLREMAEGYNARLEGRPVRLPVPFSLHEYLEWEKALHQSPEFASDLAYWLGKYPKLPAPLEVPGDHPRPRSRSDRGHSEIVVFPGDLPRRLQKTAAGQGATLFSILLASYTVLLQKLSGQRDLVVGVPSAGQSLVGADHLIGHCVNLLPLRLESSGAGEPFAELLGRVQGEVMEAFEHRTVTFGALLRRLVLPRDASRVPLVATTFNLDPPLSDLEFTGLPYRLEVSPRAAYQFDLGINCDTFAEGFRVIFHYNTDLYEPATIRAWAEEFRQILEMAATDPQQPLAKMLAPKTMPPSNSSEDMAPPAPMADATAPPSPKASAPALAALTTAAGAPVQLWPSSPAAGGDQVYDDILYNAMLADITRADFFRRCAAGLVRDKVVVDVGTGRDALLARICIEAGARKVYAIELVDWAAAKAKQLVEKLGLADRIIVLQGRAQEVDLPERVDVCIAENVGNVAGAESGDYLMAAARERFMGGTGAMIPARAQSVLAAVSLPPEFLARPVFETLGSHYAAECWKQAGYKYDMRLTIMGTTREMLASTTGVMERLDFSATPKPSAEETTELVITRAATIDGFLVWLHLEGGVGQELETLDYPDSWLPVYLPVFDSPLAVKAGDRIHVTVVSELSANGFNRDYHLRGRVERQEGGAQEFTFSSWHYKQVYQANAFYARLFAGHRVPVYGEAPRQTASPARPAVAVHQPEPTPAVADSAGQAESGKPWWKRFIPS